MNKPSLPELVCLVLCLGVALVFRLNLDNSGESPWTFFRNDEIHYHALVHDFFQGHFNVTYFINPTCYAYMIWVASSAVGWIAVLSGKFGSFVDFQIEALLNPWWFLIVARSLAITSGVAAVFVMYAIGRRLRNGAVGLIAALALAIDNVHVERSQMGINEAPMVLCVLLFFHVLCAYVKAPTRSKHLVAGLFLGLACSIKYNAGIHLLTLLAGTLLACWPFQPGHWRGLLAPKVWLGFLAAPLAFLAGSPGVLLEPGHFWDDFREQSAYLTTGFVKREKQWDVNGWRTYLERFPEDNVGLWFSLLCAAGLVWCVWLALRKRDVQAALLLVAVLPLAIFLGSGTFVLTRFLLPAIPLVLLAGALLLEKLIHLLGSCLQAFAKSRQSVMVAPFTTHPVLAVLFAALLLAGPARATWKDTWLEFGRVDSRIGVARILSETLVPGLTYADLVYPAIQRFFDDHFLLRRRNSPSRWTAERERARWERFQRQSIRSLDITELVRRSPDLATFRANLLAQNPQSLIVVLPVEPGAQRGSKDDPKLAFESRGRAFRKLRPHEPALQSCTYFPEWIDYLLSLSPEFVRLTPDGRTMVMALEIH